MIVPTALHANSELRKIRCRLAAAVIAAVAVLGLSGCQSMVGSSTESAQVRFIDTSVDSPALDLYVNGNGAAYSLGYATFSSYIPVTPGTSLISANRANTGQALVNAHAALAAAHQYTAVVSSRLGSLQEKIYPDLTPAAVPGMLSVRVLNEADGAPLDVYLVPGSGSLASAAPLASGLSFTGATGYEHIAANTAYTVAAIPAGAAPSAANAVTVSGITLTGGSGAVRTVVLSDLAGADGKGVYGFVLDDGEGQ